MDRCTSVSSVAVVDNEAVVDGSGVLGIHGKCNRLRIGSTRLLFTGSDAVQVRLLAFALDSRMTRVVKQAEAMYRF